MLYVPSFEGPHWHVVDALTGDPIAQIETGSGAHNTVFGLDGRAGLPRRPEVAVLVDRRHDALTPSSRPSARSAT